MKVTTKIVLLSLSLVLEVTTSFAFAQTRPFSQLDFDAAVVKAETKKKQGDRKDQTDSSAGLSENSNDEGAQIKAQNLEKLLSELRKEEEKGLPVKK